MFRKVQISDYVGNDLQASAQWLDVVAQLNSANQEVARTVRARNAFHDAMIAHGYTKRDVH